MSEPTYSALRTYRRRVAAMMADPECTEDLLLIGIALLDYAVLRSEVSKSFDTYAEWVFGAKSYRRRMVTSTLKSDIRRYDAVKDADSVDPARTCGAPMQRRGGPCGQSATRRAMLTDPDTGRKQWIAACRRHRDWLDARTSSNRRAVSSVEGGSIPCANAGGVLARHIPEIDWPKLWLKLDPKWTPPPEGEPEEVSLKPRLTLVLGGAG